MEAVAAAVKSDTSAKYQLGDILVQANIRIDQGDDDPWHLPNWTKPSEYPDKDATSDYQWRWEFCRRHQIYRYFWLLHQKNYDSTVSWQYTDGLWRAAGRMFGLDYLISPACPYSEFIGELMARQMAVQVCLPQEPLEVMTAEAHDQERLLLSIDLTVPPHQLRESIEAALKTATNQREAELGRRVTLYPERWHRKKFPNYLRALDASFAMTKKPKLTWSDVTDALELADERAATQLCNTAREWCDKFASIPPV